MSLYQLLASQSDINETFFHQNCKLHQLNISTENALVNYDLASKRSTILFSVTAHLLMDDTVLCNAVIHAHLMLTGNGYAIRLLAVDHSTFQADDSLMSQYQFLIERLLGNNVNLIKEIKQIADQSLISLSALA